MLLESGDGRKKLSKCSFGFLKWLLKPIAQTLALKADVFICKSQALFKEINIIQSPRQPKLRAERYAFLTLEEQDPGEDNADFSPQGGTRALLEPGTGPSIVSACAGR